jgi:hypothetical protein
MTLAYALFSTVFAEARTNSPAQATYQGTHFGTFRASRVKGVEEAYLEKIVSFFARRRPRQAEKS